MMPTAAKNRSNHQAPARFEHVWGTVQLEQPSPIQRILLVTDGTVTEILEAYAGEKMQLVKLHEETLTLGEPLESLDATAGQHVLRRKILLQGSVSHQNFLYADSYLALDRLSLDMRDALLLSHKPIGYVLQECRLETFREIVTCGRERAGELGVHFGLEAQSSLITRTYRVIAGQRPIMLITEKFPAIGLPR